MTRPSVDHAECPDLLEQWMDLGAISRRTRARQPELLEYVSPIVRVLCAERCRRFRSFASTAYQRIGSHQEQLSTSIAGISFQGFSEQCNCLFGPAQQQFGKTAKEKPDAVPPICRIEAHRPLDGRKRLVGATEKSRIVSGESVGDR